MIAPIFTDYPEVKGVFVGGCVLRGEGSRFRAQAHAHMGYPSAKRLETMQNKWRKYYRFYNPDQSAAWIEEQVQKEVEHLGWICVLSSKRLYNAAGQPSNLMLHELAHILTGQGHNQAWATKLRELGGKVPKGRYRFVK